MRAVISPTIRVHPCHQVFQLCAGYFLSKSQEKATEFISRDPPAPIFVNQVECFFVFYESFTVWMNPGHYAVFEIHTALTIATTRKQ